MKTAVFAFCFFCGTAAFGQSILGTSALATPYQSPDHPRTAGPKPLSHEQALVGCVDCIVVAQGEMCLADAPSVQKHETPLGDVARFYRRDHELVKKAAEVKEN
jgi:hypothetical protein